MIRQQTYLTLAAAVLAIPAGFGIAQAVAVDDDAANDTSGTINVSRPGSDNAKILEDVDVAKEGQPLDLSRLEMGTPLGECPDALSFFERPDVKAFSEEHFGYSLSATDYWDGPCPDVTDLEADYLATQAEVTKGM